MQLSKRQKIIFRLMEIAEIKAQLTLARVLQHYGLKPDKHLRLHCPFHDDKTPSLQVYYKTHTAYCFSSNCKTHGQSMDVIDFVHAQGRLHQTRSAGEVQATDRRDCTTTPPAEPLTRTAVLTKLFTYFKNAVHNSKPAQEYIKEPGTGRGQSRDRLQYRTVPSRDQKGRAVDPILFRGGTAIEA